MSKSIPQHKAMAMGERVTGMKHGGCVKAAKAMAKGGTVHDDAAMDKKLITAELKKRGLAKGGRC